MLESLISIRRISKKVMFIFIISISILSSWIFIKTYNNQASNFSISESNRILQTSTISNTTQWLKDPSFDSGLEYWKPNLTGDISDVDYSINSGQANIEILGDKRIFSLIANPPLSLDWSERDNINYPNRPQIYGITTNGCTVYHLYDDQTAVTNPSIHWDRNISLNVDMSDYIITSASFNAIVYANASLDIDREGDTEARNDLRRELDTYDVGDYVRFYALISDLGKNKVYELAYLQPTDLGMGDPPGEDIMLDTYMISYPEEDLLFYLSSVLNTDYSNFTLTLGILLHFEDNIITDWDYDEFKELIIKSVNFTFSYEKKIDRYTSISYNQKLAPIEGEMIEIIDATLDFKYKVNQNWSDSLSPNSVLRILINNNELEKVIKLKDFETNFKELNLGASDIRAYIVPNLEISFSIMIFIADDFTLEDVVTFSIDDVYLTISYVKHTNYSFPYYTIWLVMFILLTIIAILTSLSLRSYILIPRKIKKRTALLSRTQKFKDAENIQGILLIHNPSGLPLFSRNYSDLMEGNKTLFSGFLQAISIVGEEIIRKDYIKSKGIQTSLVNGIHNVLELDFKHFYCLISDIEELRTVLILRNKASKRIKSKLLNFGLSVYAKYSEVLKDWNHDTNQFLEGIPPLLDNFFNLNYKLFYRLTIEKSDLEPLKKTLKSSRINFRILNEIISISEENHIFKLNSIFDKLSSKSEDIVIDTIELLIEKRLLIPAESIEICL
ncbi:MAG: hypothetical protein ACFE9S_12030 [Candidatus Hermodarchaeota archaeon]